MKAAKWLYLLVSVACLSGCGTGETEVTDGVEFFVPKDLNSVTDDPFDSERMSVVQIIMPANDFEALKWEGRSLDVGIGECPSHDFEYTQFSATVNIDGEVFEHVGIRKKGYLGSLSSSKPSLKLDFDEFVEGRQYKTLSRMTLNNNRQDPTHARQCLAYSLYEKVGLPAPRCALSQVFVNGKEMGVYTHVESIKKPFLARSFGDDEGNLYEAQISDFGNYLGDKFEKKTNKTENDRSDLLAVAQALDIEDDALFLTTVSELVDIDEFILYWAMDAVIGNWDSATGNANNYYIYRDPNDGLFHFIPWGLDAAFTGENILKRNSGPLYRSHRLAARLFDMDNTREQYYTSIQSILSDHWNESLLIQEIDRIAALAQGEDTAYAQLKEFIQGSDQDGADSQRDTLLAAITNNGAGQTDYTLEDEAINCDPLGTTDFTASFESRATGDAGNFRFTHPNGRVITTNMQYVSASPGNPDSLIYRYDDTTLPATHALSLVGVDVTTVFAPNPDVYVMQVSVEAPFYKPGSTSLHGFANSLMLFKFISENELELMATGTAGEIRFTQAGDGTVAAPIVGTINAATLRYFEE